MLSDNRRTDLENGLFQVNEGINDEKNTQTTKFNDLVQSTYLDAQSHFWQTRGGSN